MDTPSSDSHTDFFCFSNHNAISTRHLTPLTDSEITKNLHNYSIYLSYCALLKKHLHDRKMYEKYHCGKPYCRTYKVMRTCFKSEEEFDAVLKDTGLDSLMDENSLIYKLFPET